VSWSGDDPLLFGGDLNLRPGADPEPFAMLEERFGLREPTAPDAIDHVLARGLEIAEPPRRLAPERRELTGRDGRRLRLSDHRPIAARFVA
jgi:endonuclease/exonuclease/phosphatase (EEP) superfamily protein YafD